MKESNIQQKYFHFQLRSVLLEKRLEKNSCLWIDVMVACMSE